MQISYSAYGKYTQCPYSYKLHYIDKIRPKTVSSALFFGGYIGQVWQALVLTKKPKLTTDEEKLIKTCPYTMFDTLMSEVEINGEYQSLPKNPNIRYFMGDYDPEVMLSEDFEELDNYAHEVGLFIDDRILTFDDLYIDYSCNKLEDTDLLSFMNYHFWISLRRKGHLLIKAYIEQVLPNIIEVEYIEKPIKIDLSYPTDAKLTDYLVGYVDLICSYKLDEKQAKVLGKTSGDIVRILFDHKTASTRYSPKKLKESEQLNIYDFCEQCKFVGYIVGIKKLKKPKIGERKGDSFIEIQVMIDYSNSDIQDATLDSIETVLTSIKNEDFPKKFENCDRIFGKPCIYREFCKRGSMQNLSDNKNKKLITTSELMDGLII